MAHFIPLRNAAEELGLTVQGLQAPRGRFKHLIKEIPKDEVKTNKVKYLIDIDEARRIKSLEERFIAKVQLFIEWMVHEEGIDYKTIAWKSKLPTRAVVDHNIKYRRAMKITKAFNHLIPKFDRYYDW